ncbi:MAG: hypothetical protein R2568_09730 [Candidatus Scalindua sp.]|jgi:hypothetical protein|nr:hypothetical protein [Candidatus Scalindua sp.]MDV5167008.1 hypothetical protein [Candidatus Scalindua sp.]
MNKFNIFIGKIKNLVKDPERILINKHNRYHNTIGFRIDLYAARKYKIFFAKRNWFKLLNLKVTDIIPEQNRSKTRQAQSSPTKHPEKTFCPYCEKAVVPKRLHKLDFADIVLALFTAGLWAIFLCVMYLFIRKCPTCNYNLRGFKFLSEKKRR